MNNANTYRYISAIKCTDTPRNTNETDRNADAADYWTHIKAQTRGDTHADSHVETNTMT